MSSSVLVKELTREVEEQAGLVRQLQNEVGKVIVAQQYMVDRIIMALLADGHILLEGVPGLAKTSTVKTLAAAIATNFSRIQFTPDLLPADLLGTEIYRPQSGEFTVKKGPIFTNLLLADEINRAPAKVQSALLEAMQERQVTIGETTYKLPEPFLVLATQNPLEQEGTYPLPEAQVDRFMLKLQIGYPDKVAEKEILRRLSKGSLPQLQQEISMADILKARAVISQIYLDAKVEDYIVEIVFATRQPELYRLGSIAKLIAYGASPRATIYLAQAAKVQAFMSGRAYVTPQDVKTVGPDVLRHRLLLSYEAEARDLTSMDIIQEIFNTVDVP